MMDNFGLCVILTNPRRSHADIARICVDEGVRMLQLREKTWSDRKILTISEDIRKITSGTDTLFFINDRPDLARIAGADGLHIGQDDVPAASARKIIGREIQLGISTHTLQQVNHISEKICDYIGFGPVYPTPTKAEPDPVTGPDILKTVLCRSPVPVVAIGGINRKNLDRLLQMGIRNAAMVRELMETRETDRRIRWIMNRFRDAGALH
ncbi:MAG TPA: thiamine phosphate synthase [bacterium]|nr:thiamine phosphate synthase [bacterium]